MDKTSSFSIHKGKPIRCKAALCRKAREALVMEEIQVDPPQAYEVRIKIICTSLCHTDVTFWKLDSGPLARFPRILGHESVGLVESVGEHVDGFKQGDVVLPVFHPNCEECKDCKSSKSNWCARYANDSISNTRRYGMASRFKDSTGEDIHHFLFVSSFSEYTVVDIAHLVKISPDIPVQKAALLSCGVSTGVGAAWKVANVEEGSTVAVFGLGAVGLAAAEGARLRGAAKIIGVDLNPDKFELEMKPVEVAPEITTTTQEVEAKEESPAEEAVEDKSKSPEVTSEEAPAATEEAPANEENTSEEVAEETPDEIKLETAPADFRFPTTNQTRHCFTRYIEYHRCVAAKGDEAPECDKFSKFYRSLCPGEWVDRWNEQRENGTFPGPL
ncbi:hypothetical protein F2Q68_00013929 [Brassica cretica]|uniref:Alcohol dehydrogenase-like N-terminal domain-containing protein n=1 Tax=Brassica cretica TaxID=69181 RepID=A0A8S9HFX1_BRACR|nr:hypothetical protein F2Q68_00013929 [Brassica cretica]